MPGGLCYMNFPVCLVGLDFAADFLFVVRASVSRRSLGFFHFLSDSFSMVHHLAEMLSSLR